MDTSLIINSTTPAGKKASKALSNINPAKDNQILKTFAQKVNALTSNTYVDATRINKQSVEEAAGQKIEGVITLDRNDSTVHYNGDGTLYMQQGDDTASTIENGANAILLTGKTNFFFATATDKFTAAVLVIG